MQLLGSQPTAPAGDPFRKVTTGSPLQIPAVTWNTILDMLADWKSRKHGGRGDGFQATQQATVVLLHNTSGSAVGRHGVLSVVGPLLTPTQNLNEFESSVKLAGYTPSSGTPGKFAITLEPIASGAIGRAVIAGVAIVQVEVTDSTHTRADTTSVTTKLTSSLTGSAEILWRETGSTGLKWAIVRLGPPVELPCAYFSGTLGASGTDYGSTDATLTAVDHAGIDIDSSVNLKVANSGLYSINVSGTFSGDWSFASWTTGNPTFDRLPCSMSIAGRDVSGSMAWILGADVTENTDVPVVGSSPGHINLTGTIGVTGGGGGSADLGSALGNPFSVVGGGGGTVTLTSTAPCSGTAGGNVDLSTASSQYPTGATAGHVTIDAIDVAARGEGAFCIEAQLSVSVILQLNAGDTTAILLGVSPEGPAATGIDWTFTGAVTAHRIGPHP